MSRNSMAIVSVPERNKHYVIKSSDKEEMTFIGNVCINGSIIGIGNTYEEANIIYKNMNLRRD